MLPLLLAVQARATSVAPGAETLLQDIFDGRTKIEAVRLMEFTPGFVVPETVQPAPETILITAEVSVAPSHEIERDLRELESSIENLRRTYGFIRDLSFEPRPSLQEEPRFTIQPYPSAPRASVYSVRGFVRSNRYPALLKDKAVRKAVVENLPERTPEALLRFLDAHAAALVAVPGVESLGLGFDCGMRGEHQHVLPHRHVIVLTLSAGAQPAAVERSLTRKVPEFSEVPHRFEVLAQAENFSWAQR